MQNVAFLFTGVGNLSGGGGAERFFSDFFEEYQRSDPKFNLFFISDKASLENFSSIGNLKYSRNVLTYRIINNRFKNRLEAFQIERLIKRNNIKLIQVPLYNVHYYPILNAIDNMSPKRRPKISITITDSFIPHYYFNDDNRGYNFRGVFEGLFNSIKVDSVISWYKLFKDFAEKNNIIKSKPQIFYITSRYSGKQFNEATPKSNNIIFAGRLTIAKRPLMFVEAVRILDQRCKEALNWKFIIYGKGNLEEEVKNKIKQYGLDHLMEVRHGLDLTRVFEESKCFVSTQDLENFPSLSMNEAMAAGNAVIARNVGQTELFVKDNVNGFLLKNDDEQGLADALENYILHPEIHERMSKESIRLTKEVHTFDNFKTQIESFWEKTLQVHK